MKSLSWNCRGLGNQATVRALQKFLSTHRPEIVFLMETRLKIREFSCLNQRFLHFEGCIAVDCDGEGRSRKGGLAIIWRGVVDMTLIHYSSNHILLSAHDSSSNCKWFLSGIYGWPEAENKWRTWDLLERIKRNNMEPWCCFGDFNEIMWSIEKKGGRERSYQAMLGFREAILRCELLDIGYIGHDFTWSNGRSGSDNIQARLDRVLVNSTWNQLFPSLRVKHLGRYKSDHAPLLFEFDRMEENNLPQQKRKRFRFENMWMKHPDFVNFVKDSWISCNSLLSVSEKIQICGEKLLWWDEMVFGNVKRKIRQLNKRLEALQANKDQSKETIQAIHQIESELDDLLKKEEIMWLQRSRTLWLKEGDRNTKFFHNKANQRQKKNSINKLLSADGRWVTKKEELMALVREYYINLFRSDGCEVTERVLRSIPKKVTETMNRELTKSFTKDEVKKALQQMHPTKAPGPDGMTPFFFQKFWNIVGDDVSRTVLGVLNDGVDPSNMNTTHIVLIPKIKQPETVKDFRPISLCNVIFRVITKCIANRLKPFLHDLVSINQSAFIPSRLITDNVMTAFEIFHSMKKKKKGRIGQLAMKLDMSKAYDRVEWSFLRKVMQNMGFCEDWVNLIMRCVSTVSYSVLLNSSPSEFFLPERGLRQGDPLSPYLFLLCADVLSNLLIVAGREGRIHGAKISRNAPTISHLFFADDSILFFRATREEVDEIQQIIHIYESASGQRINMDKTEMTVSRNVPEEMVMELCNRMGVKRVQQHDKYLGLPTLIGRSKKQVFASILDRVEQKCKGWKVKSLSKAGREVMLKSVIQAIPTYTMSCFLIPDEILKAIERVMARFYWGANQGESKIHWIGWKGLTKRKEEGGLGFRELRCFNLAMLAKQLWRLHQNQETLIFQILKAKYFPRNDLREASLGYQPSYLWRSILSSRDIIEEGSAWRVGDGACIKAVVDRWIGGPYPKRPRAPHRNDVELSVADLIDDMNKCWKEDKVRELFPEEAEHILAIPISSRLPPDKRVWGFTSHGLFSVKSAYRLAISILSDERSDMTEPLVANHWKQLWRLKIPPKIANFMWQACNDRLPTLSNLCQRGLTLDPLCRLCGEAIENQSHLFMECSKTIQVWLSCSLHAQNTVAMGSFQNFVWCALSSQPFEHVELLAIVAWNIWNARNKLIFENHQWVKDEILQRIHRSWMEIRSSQSRQLQSAIPNEGDKNLSREQLMPGWVSLETDVAVPSLNKIGMGFVLRHEDGRIILAAREEANAAGSSTLLEGLAMRFALSMVLERSFDNIAVRSDNQVLIRALKGQAMVGEFEDLIVEDIRELAARARNICFEYINRKSNCAAHHMAKGPTGVFTNVIPSHIAAFV